jgi:hypothetical protein
MVASTSPNLVFRLENSSENLVCMACMARSNVLVSEEGEAFPVDPIDISEVSDSEVSAAAPVVDRGVFLFPLFLRLRPPGDFFFCAGVDDIST